MSMDNNKLIFISILLLLIGSSQYSFFDKNIIWAALSIILSLISLSVFFKFQKKLKVWSRNPFYTGQPVVFLLWSNKIKTEEEDDKEDLLIANLNLKIKGYRLLMSVLVIGLGILFLFQFGINISLYGFVLFVFNTLFLVLSSYIGHLLILGLINSALSFIFVDQSNYPLLILEIALFCSFIVSFVGLKKNHDFNIRRVLNFFVLLTSLILGFSFILPSELSLINYKNKKSRQSSLSKKSKGGMEVSFPTPPKVKITQDQVAIFNKLLDQHEKDLDLLGDSLAKIPNFASSDLEEINQLKLEVKNSRGELATISLDDGVSEQDLLDAFKRIEKITEKKMSLANNIKGRVSDTEKGYELYPNKSQEDLLKAIKTENLKLKAESISKVKEDKSFDDLKKEIKSELNSKKEIYEEKTQQINDEIKRKEIVEKREDKTHKNFKWVQKLFRVIVLFLVVLFVLYLFKRRKKSVEILDRDIKETMKRSLKAISKLHLTPNQEIIKSYNIFKQMIKDDVFPDTEVPPPVTLCKLIAEEANPDATWSVTDLFCDCFYGNYNASESDRKRFRSAFKLLLK